MKALSKPLPGNAATAVHPEWGAPWRWVAARMPAIDAVAAFALGISAAYFFVGLGSFGLLDNNEGLYAQVAHSMALGGDWIIPQLNGLPYLEKPPLFYYLLALSFHWFGETAQSARLVSAASALGCLLAMLWFGARVAGRRAAGFASLVLGSSMGFIIMAREVMPDMLLTSLLTAALLTGYAAMNERNRLLLRTCYVFLALGTLTKGLLVPALFGLIFGVFTLLRRRGSIGRMIRFFADPVACALFFLVAAPWHLLAAGADADFASFYFINEHVMRFLGRREPHDFYSGPVWYYLPRLLLFLFPWPAYLLLVFERSRTPTGAHRDLRTFLWIAGLVPLLFFTVSQAKANYNALVAMPPLALAIGLRMHSLLEQGGHRLLAIPIAVLITALGSFAVLYGTLVSQAPEAVPISPRVAQLAVASIVLLGAYATLLALRHRTRLAFASVALMAAPLLAAVIVTVQEREAGFSSRPLATTLAQLESGGDVFLFQDFEKLSALPYYLKRPVRIIDSRSNALRFGQRRGANPDAFLTTAQFLAAKSERPRWVVVAQDRKEAFLGSPLFKELGFATQVGRTAVYIKRP